ncbi:MAG: D-glycerate dehydrogenase [Deinococcales bacterium]
MRVFVTRKIPEEGLKLLYQAGFEVEVFSEDRAIPRELLLEKVTELDALLPLVTDSIDKQLLEQAPKLKIVANFAVGYNNVDVATCTQKGILVTNTPDVLTAATADQTMLLILATARRLIEGDGMVREGRWEGWGPLQLLGLDVSAKALGLIGMGRIGEAVAKRAKGFDMQIFYHNRNRNLEAEKRTGAIYVGLPTLLEQSDFVSIHTPLSPESHHLIGEKAFKRMKKTAILINTARGPVVDEKALVKALTEGEIWGAGLDVFEREPLIEEALLKLPNVVLAPHLGSATLGARGAMARLSAGSIIDYLQGKRPKHIVNPEVLA